MIAFDDLARKSKSEIRNSDKLSEAFEFYFEERYNSKASFCCSFSDYHKLFNTKKLSIMTKSKKYKVGYSPNTVLSFRDGKVVRRSYAKNATDDFLQGFLKNHSKGKFPTAKQKVELIEKPKKKEDKKPEQKSNEPKE